MTPSPQQLPPGIRARPYVLLAGLAVALIACAMEEKEGSVASEAAARGYERSASAPPAVRNAAVQDLAVSQSGGATLPTRLGDTVLSLIIRTGDARIEVRDIRTAVTQLRELVQRVGGTVANSTYQGGRYEVRSATLELRIPAQRYDEGVGALDRLGRVEYVNSRAEDVGEEYYDAAARLSNARRLEERLLALLATRTGKLEDVLAVERELARVRGEIEAIEGRMRYLRTRAAMSTLIVTVHEPEPLLGGAPGENPLVGALRQAWRNFVAFITWLIAAVGILIPLVAAGAIVWLLVRRRLPRWRRWRSAAKEER